MNSPLEYAIVTAGFDSGGPVHEALARKVNEKLAAGYEPLGAPFFAERMLFQAMIKRATPGQVQSPERAVAG